MIRCIKMLASGNRVTLSLEVKGGKATMVTEYADPPSDADRAEMEQDRNMAAAQMGMEPEP